MSSRAKYSFSRKSSSWSSWNWACSSLSCITFLRFATSLAWNLVYSASSQGPSTRSRHLWGKSILSHCQRMPRESGWRNLSACDAFTQLSWGSGTRGSQFLQTAYKCRVWHPLRIQRLSYQNLMPLYTAFSLSQWLSRSWSLSQRSSMDSPVRYWHCYRAHLRYWERFRSNRRLGTASRLTPGHDLLAIWNFSDRLS